MRRDTLNQGVGVLALTLGIVLAAGRAYTNSIPQAEAAAPKTCSVASLAGLKLDGVQAKSVTEVPAGSFAPLGAQSLTNLPAFCRVEAMVTATSDSLINFEVWLPTVATWNGKLVTTGNGGYSNIHSITEAGKRIIAWIQGKAARRAYFCGCSTGGHVDGSLQEALLTGGCFLKARSRYIKIS